LSLLDVSNNRLTSLEGIKRLANLRYLNVSNNRLREFEEQVTKLALLEHLDVSFNRISEMPDTFGLLRELRFLNLSNNRIVEIPNDRFDVLGSVQVRLGRQSRSVAVSRGSVLLTINVRIGKGFRLPEPPNPFWCILRSK